MGLFTKMKSDVEGEINIVCGEVFDISHAADFHHASGLYNPPDN